MAVAPRRTKFESPLPIVRACSSHSSSPARPRASSTAPPRPDRRRRPPHLHLPHGLEEGKRLERGDLGGGTGKGHDLQLVVAPRPASAVGLRGPPHRVRGDSPHRSQSHHHVGPNRADHLQALGLGPAATAAGCGRRTPGPSRRSPPTPPGWPAAPSPAAPGPALSHHQVGPVVATSGPGRAEDGRPPTGDQSTPPTGRHGRVAPVHPADPRIRSPRPPLGSPRPGPAP